MFTVTRRAAALAAAFAALVCAAACSGLIDRRSELDGSVYARQIPAYPGAKFEDSMGGTTSAGIGGPAVSESMSWFYRTTDPVEKVVAFYVENLPGATRDAPDEDGAVVFRVKPKMAGPDEYVTVKVRPGELQITEVTTPKQSRF
jgi:hypothetical protein